MLSYETNKERRNVTTVKMFTYFSNTDVNSADIHVPSCSFPEEGAGQ